MGIGILVLAWDWVHPVFEQLQLRAPLDLRLVVLGLIYKTQTISLCYELLFLLSAPAR